MKFLLVLLLLAYTATWITGVFMTRTDQVDDFKKIHFRLSLVT